MGFWALVNDRFQTLTTRTSDGLVIAAVAILLSLLWQARAKRLETREGASINASDSLLGCDPPLMSAAAAADLATVDFLLRHGADPNRANADGATPLMRAVTAQSLPVVRLLLSHHANPEALANGAESVMGMALKTGDSSIIRAIADAIPPKALGSHR